MHTRIKIKKGSLYHSWDNEVNFFYNKQLISSQEQLLHICVWKTDEEIEEEKEEEEVEVEVEVEDKEEEEEEEEEERKNRREEKKKKKKRKKI